MTEVGYRLKSRKGKLGGLLGFILVLNLVMVGGVLGADYSVCSSGCDYSSIQEAVDGASNGDTINVLAGNYTENVDVKRKEVNLVGFGARKTTINFDSSQKGFSTVYVIGKNLNIRGFTLEGNSNGKNSIFLDFSQSTIIMDNYLNDGIKLHLSSNNSIFNNYFGKNPILDTDSSPPNYWNIQKKPGVNIVGGPYLGGNYWASSNGTGYSEICKDSDRDGICDSPYNFSPGFVDYLPLSMNYGTFILLNSRSFSANNSALLNISITNVTNLNVLNFNITFDPSIIAIKGIQTGDFLSNATTLTNINNPSGWAAVFFELPVDTGVNGSGIIAAINITGKSDGISNLTLLPLNDIYLVDKFGEEIVPEVINGTINVKIPRYYGLVAEYNFEGNAEDSSGNGYNGTIMNGAGFATGINGTALSLDGYDDYVDMGDVLGFQENFTLSAWIKTTSKSPQAIISKFDHWMGGGYKFSLYSQKKGAPSFYFHGGKTYIFPYLESDISIGDGRWHHLVAVREAGAEARLYIDGILRESSADNGDISIDYLGNHLLIGGAYDSRQSTPYPPGTNTDPFNGLIDQVKLYNIAINESEILSQYRTLVPGSNVCPSGCDFTSIQKAVDNASTGDTVNVLPGTYTENVIINKSINLIGAGMENSHIIASDENRHAIEVTGNNVNISGFGLTGARAEWRAGLFLNNSGLSNINYINSSFNDFGILLNNSHNNVIMDSSASANQIGICLNNGSHDNVVEMNSAHLNNGSNIYIRLSNNNRILNNSARDSISYVGIYLKNSSNNLIYGNDASENLKNGIMLVNSSHNSVKCNIAKCNKEYHGIVFADNSNSNSLIGNIALENRYNGIGIWSSRDNLIQNNTANNNIGAYGFLVHESENNILKGNYASGNNVSGFVLYDSSHNQLIENTGINTVKFDGFALVYSQNNLLLDNLATGNRYHGIELYYSNNNIITNNTANSSILYGGIFSFFSDYNTISGNIFGLNEFGIFLDESRYNTINNNFVQSNNKNGIYVQDSVNNHIFNNHFYNKENFGYWGTINPNTWNTPKKEGTNILEGPNLAGNFWAKPDGSGFSQTCTDANADGICDSSYSLESGNIDNLPLSLNFAPPLHVCPSGCKYSSIQQAVDAANESQTIYVHTGEYNEGTTIDKSINLIGDGPESTIIYVPVGGSISILERINLSGFTINGNNLFNGIHVWGNHSRIFNNMIYSLQNGIYVPGNHTKIFNNTIKGNFYGLSIYGNFNEVFGNEISQNGLGIMLTQSRYNEITSNSIVNSSQEGMFINDDSHGNIISENEVGMSGHSGIAVDKASNYNLFSNNLIYQSFYSGIDISGSDHNNLIGNLIWHNKHSGIRLFNVTNNSLYNNYLMNNINFEPYFVNSIEFNTTKTPGTNIIGGPYIAGNYWADEDGTGFSQPCNDSDYNGICDDGHIINGTYIDNLPLKILMGKDAKPDNSRPYVRLTYNSSIENQTKNNDTLVMRRNSDISNFNISTINFTGMAGKIIPIKQNSSSEDAIWYDANDNNSLGDTSDYILYNKLYIIDNNTVQPALDIINDPRIFMGLDSTNGSWTNYEAGTFIGGLGWLGSVVNIKGNKYLVTRENNNFEVEIAEAEIRTLPDKKNSGSLKEFTVNFSIGKLAWQFDNGGLFESKSSKGTIFVMDINGDVEKTFTVDLGSISNSDVFTNTSAKTGMLKSSALSGTSFAGYKIFLINQTNKNIKVIVGKEGEISLSNNMTNTLGYNRLYLNIGTGNPAFPILPNTSALLMGPKLSLDINSEIDIPDTDYTVLLNKSRYTAPKTYVYLYSGVTLYDFMNPFGDFLIKPIKLNILGNDAVLSWDHNQKSTIIKSSGIMKPTDLEYSDFLSREIWLHVQAPPSPVSSGGGGGGGGGGGDDATAFISKIEKGKTEIAKFSDKKSPSISEIQITAKGDIYSVGLTLKYPSKQPYGTKEIEDEIYKFIEIKKSDTLKDENIEKAIIKFKIEKQWLKDNDINKNSVILSRYYDGEWVKLDTSLVDEDDDFAYYEAKTPGFSYFAICGIFGSGFEKPSSGGSISFEGFDMSMLNSMKPESVEEPPEEENEVEEKVEIVEPEEEMLEPSERRDGSANMPLIIVFLVGGLAAGAGFYYWKFSSKK